MFETVQIAKRHLMRYEYPEMSSALESSISWPGALSGVFAAWFSTPPDDHEPYEQDEGEVGEVDNLLLYCWPTHPY